MAGFEVNSTEEILALKESGKLKKGDILIHRCPDCGRWVLRRYRNGICNKDKVNYYSIKCQKCKTELAHLKKWGTKHPFSDPLFREKMLYKGMERIYGPGIKHAHQVPELHQKAYETTCKHFNSDHPFSCPEMIDKYKNGNFKKYDVEWTQQSPEVRAKGAKTMIEKYGIDNFFHSKEFQDSVKQYWEDNFGVTNPSQVPHIQKKVRKTINEKFNGHTPTRFYYYYGVYFDSSWELAVWIYCMEHYIPIIRDPKYKVSYYDNNGHKHYTTPDFIINGEYVEIKGSQYVDVDTGTWVYPYNYTHSGKNKRIPLSEEDKNFYNDMYESKHQALLNNGVKIMYEEDCLCMLDYVFNKYGPNYLTLYRRDNPLNPSYRYFYFTSNNVYQPPNYTFVKGSISPFDKPDKDGYVFPKCKGVSPFDIK